MLDDKPETNSQIVKMNYIRKGQSSSEAEVTKPAFATGNLMNALKKKMVSTNPIIRSLNGLRSQKIKKECFSL